MGRKELPRCRRAIGRYRFASSEGDRRRFQRHGLTTEVVLPGVSLERGRTAPDVVGLDDLRRQLGLDGHRRYCLFVGTIHAPNVAAVAAIRDIAAALAARRRNDVGFIVVGDVIPPERDGNFIALGRVDGDVLDGLYQLAELIIIPLQAGTGTSRKTLEAMSFGKPILGTSVSVRGIPVVSGTHGIVSDDVAAYPDLIVAMLDDADRRQRLGAAARELAASFDSARVYNRYLGVFREIERAQDRGP